MTKDDIQKVVDLSNKLSIAVEHTTPGEWRIDRSYVYAPEAITHNQGDDECYGGALVCESVLRQGDLLFLSLAQPNNVRMLVRAVRYMANELGRQTELLKDHCESMAKTAAATSDAAERLNAVLKGSGQ